MKWTDPAAGIALVLVVITGALLLLGHEVPPELWGGDGLALAFFFGQHGVATGSAQLIAAVANGAGPALTGTLEAPRQVRASDLTANDTAAATLAASSPPAATVPPAPAPAAIPGGSD